MMRKTLLLLWLILVGQFSLQAEPITPETAQQVASQFLTQWTSSHPMGYSVNLSLIQTTKVMLPNAKEEIVAYYLFRNQGGGFILISGDDIIQPVLAYSFEGVPALSDMPAHISDWLRMYKEQIAKAVAERVTPSQETTETWHRLVKGLGPDKEVSTVNTVNPLVTAKWDQSPHYNALAPFDNGYNQRTVAGCVATAMAMIMKYWNYPNNGNGFHSYTHQKYGVQSANFGSTTYNWAGMPNTVSSPNNAVATLLYHCGVSVNMDFGVGATGGSSAYLIYAKSPQTECSEHAFKNYFGYKSTLEGAPRDNYSQSQWIQLLKSELDASRPLLYGGIGNGGGHAFVCDGYDNNNFFHFNWGWSGSFDGYFTVNALNPDGVGTGGGSGGFNYHQQIIKGLEPPETNDPTPGPESYDMALNNVMVTSNNPLWYGSAFSITTNVANFGTKNFAGDYCAAIFDEDLNFLDFVEVKTGFTLEAGFTYTNNLVFSNSGLFSMVPGTYYIGAFYRPQGGDWVLLDDNGNFTNLLTQFVVFANTIEMYDAMITTPVPNFKKGQAASVNLNLVNTGSSTFFGEYQVNLYNLDGTYVSTISTISENNGLPSGFVYLSPFLTFTTPQLNVEPGSYLLAVMFRPSFGDWSLVGSTDHPNPVRVIVEAPGIQPDIYENNNIINQAHTFTTTFSNNTAKVLTTGSNLHEGSDLDYYRVNLAPGFNYSIQARLHDAWDSGNGQTYTLDGLFSISTDGGSNWTEAFDDIMGGPVQLSQGGNVYFQVAPYFVGETGTYLLDITIVRSPATSINEPEELAGFKLFPNPATDKVILETGNYTGKVHHIQLFSPEGKQLEMRATMGTHQIEIPLQDLPGGQYYLQIATDHGIITRKLNKL